MVCVWVFAVSFDDTPCDALQGEAAGRRQLRPVMGQAGHPDTLAPAGELLVRASRECRAHVSCVYLEPVATSDRRQQQGRVPMNERCLAMLCRE